MKLKTNKTSFKKQLEDSNWWIVTMLVFTLLVIIEDIADYAFGEGVDWWVVPIGICVVLLLFRIICRIAENKTSSTEVEWKDFQ